MRNFRPGGLPPARFLRDYWQKRPLLHRAAMPEQAAIADRDTLFELATRDDMESRVVSRDGRKWSVRHGPFTLRWLRRLPRRNWTLLVQGVNHALPAGGKLLQQFSFIPHARLDDLMASYAPPGGGVGPHFDSYDVFLLQGAGIREWRISAQRDLRLVAGAPLRILERLRPQRTFRVEAGDLLYLPPRYAHDGVAVTECVTLSVGFRAPGRRELGARFLEYLADHYEADGLYEDPDLEPTRHPGEIDRAFLRRVGGMLDGIRWNSEDVLGCLGEYLTEPKQHVVFARPSRPLGEKAFSAAARRRGVHLAPATLMLYRRPRVYINGGTLTPAAAAFPALALLADRRELPGSCVGAAALAALYPLYRDGHVLLAT